MSGRKNALIKFQTITAGDMSGNLTSAVTNIEFLDNIGFQFNFTGSPTGTVNAQVSADYAQDQFGNVLNAGNWVSLLTSPPSTGGTSGSIYLDLNQLSAPWIRGIYMFASGTGTLTAFITAKMI